MGLCRCIWGQCVLLVWKSKEDLLKENTFSYFHCPLELASVSVIMTVVKNYSYLLSHGHSQSKCKGFLKVLAETNYIYSWLSTPEHLHFTAMSSLGYAALTKDSPNACQCTSVISSTVLIDTDNFCPSSIRLLTQKINRSKGMNEPLRLFWKSVGLSGLGQLQHQTYFLCSLNVWAVF